ncbi:MAG: hypothetical protein HDQ88_08685 [Clostridia bacterium]|nr:hypothetical protein [Clostridia bacterium]
MFELGDFLKYVLDNDIQVDETLLLELDPEDPCMEGLMQDVGVRIPSMGIIVLWGLLLYEGEQQTCVSVIYPDDATDFTTSWLG